LNPIHVHKKSQLGYCRT